MAVLAASGASFAQVTLTGGVDFTWGQSTQDATGTSASKGIASTDAYVDFTAVDDLGGGVKSTAFFELNIDGGRNDAPYGGDKSFSLTNGTSTMTLVTTRSGGVIGATMLAPGIVSFSDHWSAVNAGVMSRTHLDALALTTVMGPVKAWYKYLEVNSGYAAPAAAAANVIGATYGMGALALTGEFVSYNYTDATKLTLPADYRSTKYDLTAIYDAGVAKVAVGYSSPNAGTSGASSTGTAASAMTLGLVAPMGAASVGLNYGKRDAASFTEVGANYNLSKRTFVAANYSTFTSQAGDNTNSFGVRVGQSF